VNPRRERFIVTAILVGYFAVIGALLGAIIRIGGIF
jgi:hypothetical protein